MNSPEQRENGASAQPERTEPAVSRVSSLEPPIRQFDGQPLRSSSVALLWLLAFAASSAMGTHGIAYWDAGDYVLLAIDEGKSGLLLGRPLFLWISRAVLTVGVEPAYAEPVLRWFWSAVGATAAPTLAVLAARLGLDRRAALTAGAALALSPSFAHTSHQVLTDAPALALSIAALASAASGHALRAGLILAAAIATRETAALHVVSIGLLLGRRQGVVAVVVCAAALAVTVALYQPPGIVSWLGSMSRSIASHPWSVRDLLTSTAWVLAAGPVPVALGLLSLVKGPVSARVRLVALPAAVATALLVLYPEGSFSPRYVLATAPLAFFLAAAPWLAVRPAIAVATLVGPLAVAAVLVRPAHETAARGAALTTRVPELPQGAVVVPGHFCPQARLAAAIATRRDLRFVCPGWEWPAGLATELDTALAGGSAVAVDLADGAWVGWREVGPRDTVRAWAARHQGALVAGFTVVER